MFFFTSNIKNAEQNFCKPSFINFSTCVGLILYACDLTELSTPLSNVPYTESLKLSNRKVYTDG